MSPLSALLAAAITLLGLAAAQDPSPIPAFPPWNYTGCANEPGIGRALDGASTSSANMTAELCLDFCAAADFGLAGLEYGRECVPPTHTLHPAVLPLTRRTDVSAATRCSPTRRSARPAATTRAAATRRRCAAARTG